MPTDEELIRKIETLLDSRKGPSWQTFAIPAGTVLLAIGGFWTLTQSRLDRTERDIDATKVAQTAMHARIESIDRTQELELDRIRTRLKTLEDKRP